MCCSSPSYHAPKAPNLSDAYNQEMQSALQWAPQAAATASNLYSQYAPQYVATNNSILDSLRGLSPQESQLADQSARAGMAARGNINGDANIGEEVMNRSDYANQRLAQKVGELGGIAGAGGGMGNGYNAFNPNSGPIGQQAALSRYQGQTQNAQNQFQADQANNPFTMALGALSGISKFI